MTDSCLSQGTHCEDEGKDIQLSFCGRCMFFKCTYHFCSRVPRMQRLDQWFMSQTKERREKLQHSVNQLTNDTHEQLLFRKVDGTLLGIPRPMFMGYLKMDEGHLSVYYWDGDLMRTEIVTTEQE